MAIFSLDAALAGGAAIAAVNRMTQSAKDRCKDDLIGEKEELITFAGFSMKRKTTRQDGHVSRNETILTREHSNIRKNSGLQL
jgi:hypothetical protein